MSGSAGVTPTLTICWNVAWYPHCTVVHISSLPLLRQVKHQAFDWLGENHVTLPVQSWLVLLRNYSKSLLEPAPAPWIIERRTDFDIWAVFSWENTRKCCYDLGNPSDFTEHTWTLLISQSFPVSQTSAPKIGKQKRAAFLSSHPFSRTEYDVWQSQGSIHPKVVYLTSSSKVQKAV